MQRQGGTENNKERKTEWRGEGCKRIDGKVKRKSKHLAFLCSQWSNGDETKRGRLVYAKRSKKCNTKDKEIINVREEKREVSHQEPLQKEDKEKKHCCTSAFVYWIKY